MPFLALFSGRCLFCYPLQRKQMTLAVVAATFYTFSQILRLHFYRSPCTRLLKGPCYHRSRQSHIFNSVILEKTPREQGQATVLILWSKSWRGHVTFPRSDDNPWREAGCISRSPSLPSPPAGLSPSCSRQQGENGVLQALLLGMTHFLSVFIMWRRRWLRNCSSINKSWLFARGELQKDSESFQLCTSSLRYTSPALHGWSLSNICQTI